MSVYILPTFKGYTVDMLLREFRRAIPDVTLDFIPFDILEGKNLLSEKKVLAQEVFEIDPDKLN